MQTCRTEDEICLPDSSLPRVVVIGGGFAGISLVKKKNIKNTFLYFFLQNNCSRQKIHVFVRNTF